MKISLNWLNEFVDLSSFKIDKIKDTLTKAGTEVEGVQKIEIPNLIVSEIKRAEKHPNADKLKICQIAISKSKEKQVICGANNYKEGDKVALAPAGTFLPLGEIKESKIRGILSEGMLCSSEEIGFLSGENGILILPENAKIGASISSLLSNDFIFNLEITPNRPDLLGHFGIAREIASLLNLKLKEPNFPKFPKQISKQIQINTDACKLYAYSLIENIKIERSPFDIQTKLSSIGIRPTNNVVDISNYITNGLGYPIHTFDADKTGEKIQICQATKKQITLLNQESYTLDEEDTILSNEKGEILALSGIMGSQASAITEKTSKILIESAWFEPNKIRKSSRKFSLHTEAAYRFEREMDKTQTSKILSLATAMILENCGGKMKNEYLEISNEITQTETIISLPSTEIEKKLGIKISQTEIAQLLQQIGFVESKENQWLIPSHRPDITRTADLLEEIVRLYGIEKIPSRLSPTLISETSESDKMHQFCHSIKNKLSHFGMREIKTDKLRGKEQKKELQQIGIFSHQIIEVNNPLSIKNASLRSQLLLGLLEIANQYQRKGEEQINLYEIGTCFQKKESSYEEKEKLGILISGIKNQINWANPKSKNMDFFDLKALLAEILPLNSLSFIPTEKTKYLGAKIILEDKECGYILQIPIQKQKKMKSKTPLYFAELETALLFEKCQKIKQFQSYSEFPEINCDISIEAPQELIHQKIEEIFLKWNCSLLKKFSCHFIFTDSEGKKLAQGKKAITYRLTYGSKERTLTQEEVNQANEEIRQILEKKLPITLR